MTNVDSSLSGRAATTLDRYTAERLKEPLRGNLLLAGDIRHDEARSICNVMIDHEPALSIRQR